MTKESLQQDKKAQLEEVDIWLIRDNLKVSYEERIARHQNTLDTVETLKQMGHLNRAKSPKSS